VKNHTQAVEVRPASTDTTDNGHYVREDWTDFRQVSTISQVSGVPPKWLRRLVAKELTENGLDAGAGRCLDGHWRHGPPPSELRCSLPAPESTCQMLQSNSPPCGVIPTVAMYRRGTDDG